MNNKQRKRKQSAYDFLKWTSILLAFGSAVFFVLWFAGCEVQCKNKWGIITIVLISASCSIWAYNSLIVDAND